MIDVDTIPTFRATSVVEMCERYVMILVLQTYRFAPIQLKYVRKGDDVTLSSTGINTNDPTTWKTGERDLMKVAREAFATLQRNSRK